MNRHRGRRQAQTQASNGATARPNFFIIGAAKAGTTSLAEYIGQHPDVFMSPVKEPFYYAMEGGPPSFQGPGDERGINARAVSRHEDYLSLFAGWRGESAIGEASTLYLYSPAAARRIRDELPDARIVVILRNPADRAYSSWIDLRRDGRESKSFEKALEMESMRMAAGWQHMWHYVSMSRYAPQLETWLTAFPRKQLSIHRFEDFCERPIETAQEIYRFLGVGSSHEPDVSTKHNIGGLPKRPRLHRLLATSNFLGDTARAILPRRTKALVKRRLTQPLIQRNLARPPPMAAATRRKLLALFDKDIQRTEELTGLDLSAWRGDDHS